MFDKQKAVEELKELLRIPSISAQSEHKEDVIKCAKWLNDYLIKIGLQSQIMQTEGHPVVYAQWLGAVGKPTVLIYGHYDVQAPDPLDQWISPPFEPTIRDGNLYTRGVADDKGQLFCHLVAINSILKTKNGKLPVNIKFLIEGEEEIGGPSLDKFIKDNKELLKADVCIISDSHALSPTQPLLTYGLRGLVYAQIDVSIMPRDVHSGSYGGNIPNATMELVQILQKLKDPKSQKVKIPGFYNPVRKLSKIEKDELFRHPFNKAAIIEECGVQEVLGVGGASIAERAGAWPTLDINGLHGGYIGEGAKTIIPAKASAKVSMRLVPNQDSNKIAQLFTSYVKSISPKYLDIDIKILSTGEPILMDRNSEYFRHAEKVLTKTFGNKPIYSLEGGSIPVTYTLKHLLGIDSILMGFGLPDDGLHSPNEKMSLEMFYKGIETSMEFLNSF